MLISKPHLFQLGLAPPSCPPFLSPATGPSLPDTASGGFAAPPKLKRSLVLLLLVFLFVCLFVFFQLCCWSVAQSCLTLCHPMNCSTPSFPVHHQLLELAQTHVHQVSDAIHPSHPLSSPSPPAFNLSQLRVFSNESVLRIRWPKYWTFSFSISPSSEYSGLISFRMDWFDLLAVQGTLKSLLQHHSSKASVLRRSPFFIV